MAKRFVSLWFPHLMTDWVIRRRQDLRDVPFVLAAPERGRMMVKAATKAAQSMGADTGMVVADCRAIFPSLQVFDDTPGMPEKILYSLAKWCLRFTPIAAVDLPDGLILDVSGCAHLWGSEGAYLNDIVTRLRRFGYDVRVAIADTIGAAWAVARYGRSGAIVAPGKQREALDPLPPVALRLPPEIVGRMEKLGLLSIRRFADMPRPALRRRFGVFLLQQLDRALGDQIEPLLPIRPPQPYQERLPALEPIRTRTGIEIALQKLLAALCQRLTKEEKGLRRAIFKAYRVDSNIQQAEIGTTRSSRDAAHLFKLFEQKIGAMEPALGFELFVLEAGGVEDYEAAMEQLWHLGRAEHEKDVAELMDRIAGKVGEKAIHRYLPAEHYWPERSIKEAQSLQEAPKTAWRTDKPRPVHLLREPEAIEVMVPLPDYPPVLFHYKGAVCRVRKADGPERIEREWWQDAGEYRDYYCVEDEEGGRYWLFRSGSYATCDPQWFLHGFFA